MSVRTHTATRIRGHEEAAAGGLPAAAGVAWEREAQRSDISSARPCWYAASRDISSASS